jgi:glycosyltransferase involved in cell wall biosynthesis
MSAASRDLLIVAQTPTMGTGMALRIYTLARALAATGEGLVLLYSRFGPSEPHEAFREIAGIELREARPSRGVRRGLLYARRRLARAPAAWARGVSPELVVAALEAVRAPDVRRVIVDGPVVATALAPLAGRRPVIYNAHNLESALRPELASRGHGSPRAFRAAERRLLELAAEAWMVSEADVEGAQALAPKARIRYVPNVVDASAIAVLPAPSREPRILMVADFTYEPNRRGVSFLLERVMPIVWTHHPELRLALAGQGLELAGSVDARVEARGFVENLASEYARAAAVVVPLLQSGGTPFKLIEALAYGVPTIATPVAAAALGAQPEMHYLPGADAAEFAAAIERVLEDKHGSLAQMTQRGRRLVEERYSIDALIAHVAP